MSISPKKSDENSGRCTEKLSASGKEGSSSTQQTSSALAPEGEEKFYAQRALLEAKQRH